MGKHIAMIFQPIASPNPRFTVGFQIEEVLRLSLRVWQSPAPDPRYRIQFTLVGIPDPESSGSSAPIRTRCRAASASA